MCCCACQVKRGRATVHEGRIASLRRVKDDVKEVSAGLECGMGVEGFTAWKEGDTIQVRCPFYRFQAFRQWSSRGGSVLPVG